MTPKRKAAKEIFIEQHTQRAMEEDEVAYDKSPVPQQAASFGTINDLLSSTENIVYNQPNVKAEMAKSKSKSYIPVDTGIKSSEELQLEKEAIKVRITGSLFWKRVIVPPNVYVVHTRINKKEPIHIGLGVSFRYNSYTDSYIVVPAAMQTIGVVANCISKEKQGINVLAYVQWQIDNFAIAYKKLDITNSNDPLGIVNAQLREQAEAAIKDKIATMSVEEVLTDKALVIEELTTRLSSVAEGKEGLGIKIITVQIREAVVSSSSLWEDLQSPFRNEQKKKARISQLEMENEINKKELETKKLKETREAETQLEIELIKQKKQTEVIELKHQEESKRYEEEQRSVQKKNELEEQTIITKKETEERIVAKENAIKLKIALEEIQQRDRQEAEELRLSLEADKRKASTDTEKKLYELQEELKQLLSKQENELKRIESQLVITEKQFELEKLQRKFEQSLALTNLEAQLEREKKEKETEVFFKVKSDEADIKHELEKTNIEKLSLEIKNAINSNQLTYSLIEKLPEIVSSMPQVKDLRVFQTDNSNPGIESLFLLVKKLFTISDVMADKESVS
jgi:flotillin